MKIRIGDDVLVTAGKYRNKKGKVLRTAEKRCQIVVEKINIRTRHIKKRPGEAGQKIHYEAPINVSNVMIICPNCSKTTRVAYLFLKTGKKQRICKKCKQSLDKSVERKSAKR